MGRRLRLKVKSVCSICGESSNDGSLINNKYYCESCKPAKATTKKCTVCGIIIGSSDSNKGMCVTCYNKKYVRSCRTGNHILKTKSRKLIEGTYIETYLIKEYTCKCGNKSEAVPNQGVCLHCYELERSNMCDSCNSKVKVASVFVDGHSRRLCKDCRVERVVGNYNYKQSHPYFMETNEDKDPLYLGFELELVNSSLKKVEKVSSYITKKGLGFLKGDSSITTERNNEQRGFEFVTFPFTKNAFKVKSKEFKGLINGLKKNGYIGGSRCGMHVHVDRAYIERITSIEAVIYKLKRVMFEGKAVLAQANYSSRNSYCQFPESLPAITELMNTSTGRNALNLGPNTIEFRFFDSTNDYAQIKLNLDTAESLVHFAIQASVVCNFKQYKAFIKTNYKNVYSYLNTKEGA